MNKIDDIEKFVSEFSALELKRSYNFQPDTTIRLTAISNLLLIKDVEALKELLKFLNENNHTYKILGWGANQVIPNDLEEVWLKLDLPFYKGYLAEKRDEYVLPASVRLSLLTKHAIDFNIRGWEVFTGIPAYIGGAVVMNAGTRLGEIGNLIKSIKKIDISGREHEVQTDASSFSYRNNNILKPGEVITEVVMKGGQSEKSVGEEIKEYLSKRNQTQPLSQFTCGCVFKNPPGDSAGRLIEVCGLKGLTKNGVRVSHKHANFFENFNNATIDDFYSLAYAVQEEIELQFGIKLEFEVKLNE